VSREATGVSAGAVGDACGVAVDSGCSVASSVVAVGRGVDVASGRPGRGSRPNMPETTRPAARPRTSTAHIASARQPVRLRDSFVFGVVFTGWSSVSILVFSSSSEEIFLISTGPQQKKEHGQGGPMLRVVHRYEIVAT
jgi:hypothetical protein